MHAQGREMGDEAATASARDLRQRLLLGVIDGGAYMLRGCVSGDACCHRRRPELHCRTEVGQHPVRAVAARRGEVELVDFSVREWCSRPESSQQQHPANGDTRTCAGAWRGGHTSGTSAGVPCAASSSAIALRCCVVSIGRLWVAAANETNHLNSESALAQRKCRALTSRWQTPRSCTSFKQHASWRITYTTRS